MVISAGKERLVDGTIGEALHAFDIAVEQRNTILCIIRSEKRQLLIYILWRKCDTRERLLARK